MNAIETWGEMVRVEHEQSDRMRGVRPTDHWTESAPQFKADPHRAGDALVEELRSRLRPGETLLDVGAGGGRLALPLALTCRTVTAVEPSPSMCSVLRETALEYNIANVSMIETGWLEASVEPADVVLCSHVVYVIEDIESFVRKMDSHARRLVLAVLFQSPPQSQIYSLWEQVHGEKRRRLCPASSIFAGWRQSVLPVHLLGLAPLLGSVGPVAGDVKLQDDGVVHDPVNRRGGGHGVGKDALPLGEDQV